MKENRLFLPALLALLLFAAGCAAPAPASPAAPAVPAAQESPAAPAVPAAQESPAAPAAQEVQEEALCYTCPLPDIEPLPEGFTGLDGAGAEACSPCGEIPLVGVCEAVTPEEGRALLEEYPAAQLVDARTPEEYEKGHVEGAVNIPLEQIALQARALLPALEADTVLYAADAQHSALAAQALVDAGYLFVWDTGGYTDW